VKDDRIYLQHIRDALDDIATYASAGREAFFAERMRQDATIRKLQVIGQAVKNPSDSSKCINLEIVWAVVEKDLRTPRMLHVLKHRFPLVQRTDVRHRPLPGCAPMTPVAAVD